MVVLRVDVCDNVLVVDIYCCTRRLSVLLNTFEEDDDLFYYVLDRKKAIVRS